MVDPDHSVMLDVETTVPIAQAEVEQPNVVVDAFWAELAARKP